MSKPLLQEVTEATGLPEELIQNELKQIIEGQGFSSENLTLEQLRVALADYMRQVILEAKDEFREGVWLDEEEESDS